MLFFETREEKQFRSSNYNYNFNKINGYFERWGKTKKDDPEFSSYGPEILDIEISTSLHKIPEQLKHRVVYDGGCKGNCPFCYKPNGHYPTYNMTLEEFKIILNKMGPQLTQLAFGVMNLDSNPDLFDMAKYARENGIIPNITIHGLDEMNSVLAKKMKETFGAVAVSWYNKEKTYDTVKALTDAGMDKVNIHFMLSTETLINAYTAIEDIENDSRLEKLNAIVFLSLKQKGRGSSMTPVHFRDFKKFSLHLLNRKSRFGFDSCTANKFLLAIKNHPMYSQIETMTEPCESGLFSSYVNSFGEFFPCSFSEGVGNWKDGISVLKTDNFVDNVWNSERVTEWKRILLEKKRSCPLFKI